MNTLLKLLKLSMVAGLLFTLHSCKDDDDNVIKPPITFNIIEIAKTDPNLKKFVLALEKTALMTELEKTGPFTVLAPSDDAFDLLFNNLEVSNIDEIDTAILKSILLNHVIPNSKLSTANLSSNDGTGYIKTLATVPGNENKNLSLYFATANGTIFNGISSVIGGGENMEATNGILHEVDNVITLPTALELVLADPNFNSLEAALTRDDQKSVLDLINDPVNTPLTIFAPTESAFDALLRDLTPAEENTITLEDIDGVTLSAVLSLHVIANANISATELTDGPTTTLGGEITIANSPAAITDANGDVSNIIVTDIQGIDGVVHAISKVILPKKS